ncbi:hypothetical protein FE392_10815 [Xenorhabdus sp. 12]|uniref:Uncharacterized protein n=1 Tax=Xenorhabdus santafensis TaxID=2582833 RepID=A0ABU4SAJ8_9GAMM|nr:hypothetical protein [Xenorhabdus sp. 12]MDX7987817.1 hypothetical protein [Xenorhabdus sp. 12]
MKLIRVYPDSSIFIEPHRKAVGKTRLTIVCHGYKHALGVPRIKIDDRFYGPQQIAQFIPAWTLITRLYSVRLLACDTASSDPDNKNNQHGEWREAQSNDDRTSSFGSQLSSYLKNIYIRAYDGRLFTSCPDESMWNHYMMGGEKAFTDVFIRDFQIDKNEADYHSVVFFNGNIVKERYSIQPLSCLGLVRE